MQSKYVCLVLLILSWSLQVFAGAGSTGGGGSVVCRGPQNQIQKAILLDLYEAINQGHITLRPALGTLDNEYLEFTRQIRRISGDIRPVGQKELEFFHQELKQWFNFLPAGVRPMPTGDFGKTAPIPPGCKVEQLATYHDENGRVDVDSEIWNSLDSRSQGALVAHEIIWRIYRKAGDKTSENTRKLIAMIFSTTPPAAEKLGVPAGAPKFWAVNGQEGSGDSNDPSSSQFYMYPDPNLPGHTVLQFTQIMGRDTLAPVRVSIPERVDLKNLRRAALGIQLVFIVQDTNANTNGVFRARGGAFDSYGITVRYKYNQPVVIGLVDPNGKLLEQAPLTEMFNN